MLLWHDNRWIAVEEFRRVGTATLPNEIAGHAGNDEASTEALSAVLLALQALMSAIGYDPVADAPAERTTSGWTLWFRRSTTPQSVAAPRQVTLRREVGPDGTRSLVAALADSGDLTIDGHDVGPGVERTLGSDEYEWRSTIRAEHIPALVHLFGGSAGEDILDLLARRFTGDASYDLEAALTASGVPVERSTWR